MKKGLPPVLPDGKIKALVLGTFPGEESLRKKKYYAEGRNRFWGMLEEFGVISSKTAKYDERRGELKKRGLALWDIFREAERKGGSTDNKISCGVPNKIKELLDKKGPFPILFNGKGCYKKFLKGKDFPKLETKIKLYCLDSTSSSNNGKGERRKREWGKALNKTGIITKSR